MGTTKMRSKGSFGGASLACADRKSVYEADGLRRVNPFSQRWIHTSAKLKAVPKPSFISAGEGEPQAETTTRFKGSTDTSGTAYNPKNER